VSRHVSATASRLQPPAGDDKVTVWTMPAALRRMAPRVPMMEAAQTRARYHCRLEQWLLLHRSPVRRILLQRVVSAVSVVIAHVVPDQPAKMLLVQRDDVVEDFAAANCPPSAPRFRFAMAPAHSSASAPDRSPSET
jgi:hypothetical protein